MARLQHKKGRKSNYVKSLNTEYHGEVRKRLLLRDNFKCRFPGCNKMINLERHHITYYVDGINIVGKELELDYLKWLVMLCEEHHDQVHSDINHPWNPKSLIKRPIE